MYARISWAEEEFTAVESVSCGLSGEWWIEHEGSLELGLVECFQR
jgi:hypothetical protein